MKKGVQRHLEADEDENQRHTGLEVHEPVHRIGEHEEHGAEPEDLRTSNPAGGNGIELVVRC